MDINALFTDRGLRAWCDDRRDQHLEDARQYGQLADILARRLRETSIEGDRLLSAWLRARQVVRHLRDMERVSRRAASDAEALHTSYRTRVLELPARREAAALAKDRRRDSRARRKALRASTARAAQQLGDGTATGYTMAAGAEGQQSLPKVADLFAKQRREGAR
ncbi:hypothetical protein [Streptomyces calidiresistens]|uniref:Uncharacterized protein n=1 Tax=Streptomyces calidiresistens TaxID=1485586 RepID=A0A7W3T6S0_9ACTN|nr:hypothetical protein [Streptomyces calidiresistens]MBB0231985.1 hypothetical protein [Streptomyces calidiresistens]